MRSIFYAKDLYSAKKEEKKQKGRKAGIKDLISYQQGNGSAGIENEYLVLQRGGF